MTINDFAARSFDFEGLNAHYIEAGQGGYPLLLIHGSGPGASTIGNWRKILGPLAANYHVFAMDLIGFGGSAQKRTPPFFDLDMWDRQCRTLIARMPGQTIGIIAHSLSAMLALKLASGNPRVGQVLTTGAMGAPFVVNEATIRCWSFPENREELRKVAECLIFDKSIIDDAYLDARVKILHEDPAYGPYFKSMFDGDRQAFADRAVLGSSRLARIICPIAMLHGRNDVAFPPDVTLSLAAELPQADVCLLARCSHSVAMERPDVVLATAQRLFH